MFQSIDLREEKVQRKRFKLARTNLSIALCSVNSFNCVVSPSADVGLKLQEDKF